MRRARRRKSITRYRIGLGVPEGGKDYAFGDTFPHEALFDQLHGVSFEKGLLRRAGGRLAHAESRHGAAAHRAGRRGFAASRDAAPRSPLPASRSARSARSPAPRGLAPIRLDRAAEFIDKGETLRAGGVPVRIDIPAWARFTLEAKPEGSSV